MWPRWRRLIVFLPSCLPDQKGELPSPSLTSQSSLMTLAAQRRKKVQGGEDPLGSLLLCRQLGIASSLACPWSRLQRRPLGRRKQARHWRRHSSSLANVLMELGIVRCHPQRSSFFRLPLFRRVWVISQKSKYVDEADKKLSFYAAYSSSHSSWRSDISSRYSFKVQKQRWSLWRMLIIKRNCCGHLFSKLFVRLSEIKCGFLRPSVIALRSLFAAALSSKRCQGS